FKYGDGSNSTVKNNQKTYASPGIYSLQLNIISDKGCEDSMVKMLKVLHSPKSNFEVSDTSMCLKGNKFIFTNKSTSGGSFEKAKWYFGDGSTDTLLNPVKSYSNNGNFEVKLISTTDEICHDTISKTVSVYISPKVVPIVGSDTA